MNEAGHRGILSTTLVDEYPGRCLRLDRDRSNNRVSSVNPDGNNLLSGVSSRAEWVLRIVQTAGTLWRRIQQQCS